MLKTVFRPGKLTNRYPRDRQQLVTVRPAVAKNTTYKPSCAEILAMIRDVPRHRGALTPPSTVSSCPAGKPELSRGTRLDKPVDGVLSLGLCGLGSL